MQTVFFESVRSMFYRNTYFMYFFFSFSREGFCYFMQPKLPGAVTWGWVGRSPLLPLLRLLCLPRWLDALLMLKIRSKPLQARRNINVHLPRPKRMLQSLRCCIRRGRRVPLGRKGLCLFLEKKVLGQNPSSSFKTSRVMNPAWKEIMNSLSLNSTCLFIIFC